MPGREFRVVMAVPRLHDDAWHATLSRLGRIKIWLTTQLWGGSSELCVVKVRGKTLTAEDAEISQRTQREPYFFGLKPHASWTRFKSSPAGANSAIRGPSGVRNSIRNRRAPISSRAVPLSIAKKWPLTQFQL